MARKDKNLSIDQKWHDTAHLGPMAKNHEFVDGEYIESPYERQEYPKMMYHPDYVHEQKPGAEYGFTQVAQRVEDAEQEAALREDGFKDSPGEFGIITAPDAAHANEKRKAAAAKGSDWRAAVNGGRPAISEIHLEFLKAAGAPVENMADVYALLAQMTSQQMNSFLAEVAAVQKPAKAGKKEKQLVTA